MKKRTIYVLKSRIWIIKAMIVSQISAWTDFGVSFLAFSIFNIGSGLSAACGAISGGLVNCGINYKWTFRDIVNCPLSHIVIKYCIVWLGSLVFNSVGTQELDMALTKLCSLGILDLSKYVCFSAARLFVSLLVSVFWNLTLQRLFVYRVVQFDRILSDIIVK
jgi:putative flippase GtrA